LGPSPRGPSLALLFVIVMDALSRMLSRAMVGFFLSRFRVDSLNATPLEISHLLFADDTLIMCNATSDQIHNLGHILLCFEAILGLKVNLRKFELVAVGEVPLKEELAGILSCSISSLPLKYLGLPLSAAFKSKAIWDGVVEKMEKGWLVGRRSTCLREGVLLSLRVRYPVYLHTFYPSSHLADIARRLERLRETFFGMV
jgi:hypothetical protein